MCIFITIIFIAELIICATLVGLIVKLDRKVCAMNIAVVAAMPKIEEALSEVRHTVHNLKKTLHSVICMVRRKKKIYILKLIKTFALCLVLVFARGKYKRMTAYSQVVLLALEYMDSLGLKVL